MAVRKTAKGAALKRWFKEEWKDVRTGKACGRKKGDKRGTPYCRPSKRVSSKTPKTSGEMTAAEKRSRIAQKKRLGQPAGKPRRVASLKRKKKQENIMELLEWVGQAVIVIVIWEKLIEKHWWMVWNKLTGK